MFLDLHQYASVGTYGFMKTKSTSNLDVQQPSDKWKSLYKMYKEWKYQKDLAHAHRLAARGLCFAPNSAEAYVSEEKTQLRKTLYAMRQQKNLSVVDKRLMDVLQQKLKVLNNIK